MNVDRLGEGEIWPILFAGGDRFAMIGDLQFGKIASIRRSTPHGIRPRRLDLLALD